MFDGVVRTLSDVRHVLNLKRNLISLSTLHVKRYKYTSEGGIVKVSKGALVMMKGPKRSVNLYVLQGLWLQVIRFLCYYFFLVR